MSDAKKPKPILGKKALFKFLGLGKFDFSLGAIIKRLQVIQQELEKDLKKKSSDTEESKDSKDILH